MCGSAKGKSDSCVFTNNKGAYHRQGCVAQRGRGRKKLKNENNQFI